MADQLFLQQFEAQSLPYADWNHRAHLKVAYLYLIAFPLEEAVKKVTRGIRAYNAAQQIVDTPTSGYHETMTQFWVRIVHAMLCEYGPAATADEFLDGQPQLGQKKLHRLFYSASAFMSPEAKTSYVQPDLAPLPRKNLNCCT